MINVVFKARMILDSCVMLPTIASGVAQLLHPKNTHTRDIRSTTLNLNRHLLIVHAHNVATYASTK
jgi:hypothetical protein